MVVAHFTSLQTDVKTLHGRYSYFSSSSAIRMFSSDSLGLWAASPFNLNEQKDFYMTSLCEFSDFKKEAVSPSCPFEKMR